MSYGNCCLVSDIDECASVVEDKAVVFKNRDIDDLREKLQMLCDKTEIVDRYKVEAADYICRKYSWDKMVSQTLRLYEDK